MYTQEITQWGSQNTWPRTWPRTLGPEFPSVILTSLTSCVLRSHFLSTPLASSSVKWETDELTGKDPLSFKFDSQENKRLELYKPHGDISE